MKKNFLFILVVISQLYFTQINAITEDGVEVVLLENGTWKLKNESDSLVLETTKTNLSVFEKTSKQTFLFKSKRLDIGVFIDPTIWKNRNGEIFNSPYLDYFFYDDSSELFALIVSENAPISLHNMKAIQIEKLKTTTDYFRIIESEYRTVNGLKVLFNHYIANVKGLDFEYCVYSYANELGYSTLTTYTYQKLFDKNKNKMMDFLNGLTKVSEKDKDIKLMEPPPPMKTTEKIK